MILFLFYYRYKRAINCLETVKLKDSKEEEETNELLSRAYTNLAVCYNKLNMSRSACMACHRVQIPTAKSHYKYVMLISHIIIRIYMD